MDTLQLTDCSVRYNQDGSLEFKYEGSNLSSQQKSSGPSTVSNEITWRVPQNEVPQLRDFISKHSNISQS